MSDQIPADLATQAAAQAGEEEAEKVAEESKQQAPAEKTKVSPGPASQHPTYEFVLAVLIPILIVCGLAGLIWYHELTSKVQDDETAGRREGFSLTDPTIAGIRYEFQAGRLTSRKLVKFYLDRIRSLDAEIGSIQETNPDAFHIADDKDMESRYAEQPIGGLHGIPVLLNGNIGTKDKMATSAGLDFLSGSVVRQDASVTALLRRKGAVIIGKAKVNLWESGRLLSANQNAASSVRTDDTKNPFSPSAASCPSGIGAAVAVSSNFAMIAVSTEPGGAILCAASVASVVGIAPGVGLTLREGVVPLAPSRDTVGPIARTLEDAVAVLDAIIAPTENPCPKIPTPGYSQFLTTAGAVGKRIGVPRFPFLDPSVGLITKDEIAAHNHHIETLRSLGAEIVDNTNLDTAITQALFPETDLSRGTETETMESVVLLHEFKEAMGDYLRDLEESPHGRQLADVIKFHADGAGSENAELAKANLEFLEQAEKTGGLKGASVKSIIANKRVSLNIHAKSDSKYKKAKKTLAEYTAGGIQKLFKDNKLHAIVAPTSSQVYKLASIAGYPGITIPAGFTPDGAPFGISFIGQPCSEPTLLEIASAFEQATTIRMPPPTNKKSLKDKIRDQKDNIKDKFHVGKGSGSKSEDKGGDVLWDGTSEYIAQKNEL